MLIFMGNMFMLQLLSTMSTVGIFFGIIIMSVFRRRGSVAWLLSFILVLLLFCFIVSFTVFTFVVTNKGAGQAVSGKGYKEYRLGDYSNWMQKRVEKSSNWNTIKSSLQDDKVCKCLADDSFNEVAEEFYKNYLSPIESGCCKPPTSCNFLYVNATYWTSTAGNSTDIDCSRWSNDEDQLCYNCNSCKAGVLANLQLAWRMIGVVNILLLISLVLSILCVQLWYGYKGLAKQGEMVVSFAHPDILSVHTHIL